MPINAICPNPACGKALMVDEKYAGMQGKCPFCGTVFTFPSLAPTPIVPEPVVPMAASAPVPPPPLSAGGGGFPPPPPTSAPPPLQPLEGAPPSGGGIAGMLAGTILDQMTFILLCAGLFFLLLLFIAILLPWISFPRGSFSGLNVAIGVILFILTLLAMGAVGAALILAIVQPTAPLVPRFMSYAIAGAAWLGTFAFFCALAGLFRPWGLGQLAALYDSPDASERASFRSAVGVGAGTWMAFICTWFITGIFVYLATRRPPEVPLPKGNYSPFMRQWLPLISIEGLAVFIGFLVFIIHIA